MLTTVLPAIDPANLTVPLAAARISSPRLGDKINTAVAGGPGERWGSEPSLHNRRSAEWPAGRHGQCRSGRRRSRNGEHTQARRHEQGYPKLSKEDSHGGSLRMLAGIVQPQANLWMTFGTTRPLWIDSPMQICHQI
jgi:hypothetical protein